MNDAQTTKLTQTFGKQRDGYLTVCTLPSTDQSKNLCSHFTHFEISVDKIEETLERNEQSRLRKKNRESSISKKKNTQQKEKQKTVDNKVKLFAPKMKEVEELSKKYSEYDWSFINDFPQKYSELIEYSSKNKLGYWGTSVYNFLTTNNELAVKIRDHIGSDIDLKFLSDIIVNSPLSMSRKMKSVNPRSSVSRIVLSTISNDMNQENYIKTILYFGGRCCYCDSPLNDERDSDYRLSGDHLTPVNPVDEHSIKGATRYGNMVLSCSGCNNLKGNSEYKDWVIVTDRISDCQKVKSLAKIQAFRNLAGYKEFSKDFNDLISSSIKDLEKKDERIMKEKGKSYRSSVARRNYIKDASKKLVVELEQYPCKYES